MTRLCRIRSERDVRIRFRNGATLSCLVVDVRDPPIGFGADTYIQMGGGVGAELDFGRAADHVNGDRMLTLIDID